MLVLVTLKGVLVAQRRIDPNRPEKACSLCTEILPRVKFYPNTANRDGLSSMCRECQCLFSTLRVYSKMSEEKLKDELASLEVKRRRIQKFLNNESLTDITREERRA